MRKWYLWVAVMLGLLSVPCQAQQKEISNLPQTEYQTIFQGKDENVYILTFTAEWCKPCQDFKNNILLPLVEKYATQEKFQFYLVDMTNPDEKDMQFANLFDVKLYPKTIILNGGVEVYSSGKKGYNKQVGDEIQETLARYK